MVIKTAYFQNFINHFIDKRDLLVQMKSSLIMAYAWQKLLKIEPGKGRIWKIYESMTYLRQKKERTYSILQLRSMILLKKSLI